MNTYEYVKGQYIEGEITFTELAAWCALNISKMTEEQKQEHMVECHEIIVGLGKDVNTALLEISHVEEDLELARRAISELQEKLSRS